MSTPLTPDTGSPPLSYGVQPFPAKDASALQGAPLKELGSFDSFGKGSPPKPQEQQATVASTAGPGAGPGQGVNARIVKQHAGAAVQSRYFLAGHSRLQKAPKVRAHSDQFLRLRDTLEEAWSLLRSQAPPDAQERMLACLANPDVTVSWQTGNSAPVLKVLAEMAVHAQSVPDMALRIVPNSVRELDAQRLVFWQQRIGTFSGAPFTPQLQAAPALPPLQPTGQVVELPLVAIQAEFDESGRITHLLELERGDLSLTGTLAFYKAAGGTVPRGDTYMRLLRKLAAAIEADDALAACASLFAPSGHVEYIGSPANLRPDALVSLLQQLKSAFTNLHVRFFEETYEEQGRRFTVEAQVEGRHTGPFSLPASVAPGHPIEPTQRELRDVLPRQRLVATVDEQGLLTRVSVHALDGSVGGPLRAYVALGGKLLELPAQRNQRTVREMYAMFARGNLDGVLAHCSEDVDWRWGEDRDPDEPRNGRGFRRLPWHGRYTGPQHVKQGFLLEFSLAEVLHFETLDVYANTRGDSVVGVSQVFVRPRSRPHSLPRALVLMHLCDFDEQGKLVRLQEHADTHALERIFAEAEGPCALDLSP